MGHPSLASNTSYDGDTYVFRQDGTTVIAANDDGGRPPAAISGRGSRILTGRH
jgi:hypothetical protein